MPSTRGTAVSQRDRQDGHLADLGGFLPLVCAWEVWGTLAQGKTHRLLFLPFSQEGKGKLPMGNLVLAEPVGGSSLRSLGRLLLSPMASPCLPVPSPCPSAQQGDSPLRNGAAVSHPPTRWLLQPPPSLDHSERAATRVLWAGPASSDQGCGGWACLRIATQRGVLSRNSTSKRRGQLSSLPFAFKIRGKPVNNPAPVIPDWHQLFPWSVTPLTHLQTASHALLGVPHF